MTTTVRYLSMLLLLTASAFAWQTPTLEEGLRLKRAQKLAEAAAIFRAIVDREPANTDAIVQFATVEGWQKHYDASIRLWERAWALRPHDGDIGIGLARVHYWKGENIQAAEAMTRVLKENPAYADALILMGDIQMASNHPDQARVFYRRAKEIAPTTVGLAKKIENATAPLRWRFDTGFSVDDYSNVRGFEHNTFEQLTYRAHPRATIWIRHDYFDHFRQVDNAIGFGASVQASKPLVLTTEFTFTPRNDFEPESKFYLAADYSIRPQLTLSVAYRHWTYPASDVNMFAPGVRWQARSWLGAMVKYNFSHNLDKSVTGALQTQMDFQVHEQVMLYGGFARGEENIPPQARAFFKVYSGGVVWNPHRRLGLRFDYSYESRRGFYDRHSVGPGIRLSF